MFIWNTAPRNQNQAAPVTARNTGRRRRTREKFSQVCAAKLSRKGASAAAGGASVTRRAAASPAAEAAAKKRQAQCRLPRK